MKQLSDNAEHRDQLIARLLWWGTWISSAVIAAGMILGVIQELPGLPTLRFSGQGVVKAGVALFILLPVMRVALTLVLFLREHDFAYAAISGFVLAIIAAGIASGL